MMWTVHLALLGWIPLTVFVYASMTPRRAMILCFVAGWMFLPEQSYDLKGLPDYTKSTAVCLGAILGTLMFDTGRLATFRLRLLDIPMIVYCLCPFVSSMANELGPYDGASAVLQQLVVWGLPYFLGRIYLTTLDAVKELALGMLIGGLVYVPLCLFEIRMSPNLNQWIYGFGGAGTEYFAELGKWGSRPRVFMGSGLALGMFMTAVSLIGLCVWRVGRMQTIGKWSLNWLIPMIVFTTVFCKNVGALALLFLGMSAMFLAHWFRGNLVIWLLLAAAPLYMTLRASGQWDGAEIKEIARTFSDRRADSFASRLFNEDILVAKALQQPAFGWGGWGRSRVYEEDWSGQLVDISTTDGLWVIVVGMTGIVGLVSLTGVFLLPAAAFFWRFPAATWARGSVASTAAIAIIVTLYMVDNLFNAMVNPAIVLSAGGLCSVSALRPRACPAVGQRGVVGRRPSGSPRHRPSVLPDPLVK